MCENFTTVFLANEITFCMEIYSSKEYLNSKYASISIDLMFALQGVHLAFIFAKDIQGDKMLIYFARSKLADKLFLLGTLRSQGHSVMVFACICINNRRPVDKHIHGDVRTWKRFSLYLPFVRGIHRSPVDSPHKETSNVKRWWFFVVSLKSCWTNTRVVGDLRRPVAQVTVMPYRKHHI